jgi:hypothetical protein
MVQLYNRPGIGRVQVRILRLRWRAPCLTPLGARLDGYFVAESSAR